MSDDHEQMTAEVRREYALSTQEVDMDGYVVVSFDEACASYDAWLARVKRDAAREALDGLAEHIDQITSHALGFHIRGGKAQDVRDYRDTHYPETEDQT